MKNFRLMNITTEERTTHEHNGHDKQKLGKRDNHHMLVTQKHSGKRPAKHMAHSQVKQWDAENRGHDKSHTHAQFLLGGKFLLALVGNARGALSARRRHSLLTQDSPVPRLGNLLGYGIVDSRHLLGSHIGVIFDLHAVLQEVHGAIGNARNLARGFVDARRACGARHPRHIEGMFHVLHSILHNRSGQ